MSKSPWSSEIRPSGWKIICDHIILYGVSNTLVAVGLRPTREEGRHWDAIKGIMLNNKQSSGAAAQQEPSVLIQASHRPKDTPLVRHLSGRDFSSTLARVETDGAPVSPSFVGRPVSIPAREMSVNKVDKTTGRSQVLPLDQLKPDLWKLAFNSVRASSRFKKVSEFK